MSSVSGFIAELKRDKSRFVRSPRMRVKIALAYVGSLILVALVGICAAELLQTIFKEG